MRSTVAALVLVALATPASAGFIISRGEADVLVSFDGTALTVEIEVDSLPGAPVFPTTDVVFQVNAPFGRVVVPSPAFAFTGAGVGETIFVIPQIENPNLPYLGLTFGEEDNGLFGPLSNGRLEFLGATGPGQVSVYQSTDTGPVPLVINGMGSLPAPFFQDVHYNYAFTQPGQYSVLVRAGVDRAGTDPLFSDTVTLLFDIEPTVAVPAPPTAVAAVLAAAGLAGLRRVRRRAV